MKNDSSVPRETTENKTNETTPAPLEEQGRAIGKNIREKDAIADESIVLEKSQRKDKTSKKKKRRNLWPLKALIISFVLAFAVNAGSELVLTDAQLWLATLLTVIILALGVVFDMVGTAATSCDVQPFLSMAARKVKGAKTAVKLAKNSDVVSSVCCDIVGDICGVVSGVCAATIATQLLLGNAADFWIKVLVYAVISTATISLKAMGKGVAVNKANGIVFGVAKCLSIFSKNG